MSDESDRADGPDERAGNRPRNLHAPWRIEYILSPKDESGCFLCRGLEGKDDRRSLLVHRGPTCAVFLNRYPYNAGHLLVAPIRHAATLADLTGDELLEGMTLCRDAIGILQRRLHPEGFNLGLNLGRCAGAGLLGHLHWHIVPRWDGDTNFMPVLAGAHVVPQALDDLWVRLHADFHP